MTEAIIFLIVLAFLALLGAGVIVLPLVAFIRTNRIGALQARVERLERELRELQREGIVAPPAPAPPSEAIADVVPAEPEQPAAPVMMPAAAPTPPPTVPAREPAATSTAPAFDLEDWIGRRGLGWIAVVLLLFATAFFLQYAFENQWIGELGRVALGVVAGTVLTLVGYRYHARGWRIFSQMLTAAGVVLLYLTSFASFGYYHLLPREHAAIFLVALIVEAAALALLYDAPAIAIMALIGGLLNPVLLRSDHDQYRNLFIYLTVLDAGAVALTFFRPWRALGSVALIGSQILFWGWYNTWYHPEKMGAALAFQGVLFVLLVACALGTLVVRSRSAAIENLVLLVMNPLLFAIAAYVLLDWDYHQWIGTYAVAMAAVYTALGLVVLRRLPSDERPLMVVIAVAMGFIAMAFALQARAGWISLGWAVEAAVLLIFAMRVQSIGLRVMGSGMLVLAIGRLLTIDLPRYGGSADFWTVPFGHPYGLSSLAVAACVWAVVIAGRRLDRRLLPFDRPALIALAVAGIVLVWVLLTVESYQYMRNLFEYQTAKTAMSVVWGVYAVVLLATGFRWHSAALRWGALGLFAITLAKVFLVDMSDLPGFYRVAAFFVLAVMMGLAAWAYQRLSLTRLNSEAEVAEHERV